MLHVMQIDNINTVMITLLFVSPCHVPSYRFAALLFHNPLLLILFVIFQYILQQLIARAVSFPPFYPFNSYRGSESLTDFFWLSHFPFQRLLVFQFTPTESLNSITSLPVASNKMILKTIFILYGFVKGFLQSLLFWCTSYLS